MRKNDQYGHTIGPFNQKSIKMARNGVRLSKTAQNGQNSVQNGCNILSKYRFKSNVDPFGHKNDKIGPKSVKIAKNRLNS